MAGNRIDHRGPPAADSTLVSTVVGQPASSAGAWPTHTWGLTDRIGEPAFHFLCGLAALITIALIIRLIETSLQQGESRVQLISASSFVLGNDLG